MLANITRIILLSAVVAVAARVLPAAATAADAEAGNALFQINCMTCHGPTGQGDGPLAAALDPKPRNLAGGEFEEGFVLLDLRRCRSNPFILRKVRQTTSAVRLLPSAKGWLFAMAWPWAWG